MSYILAGTGLTGLVLAGLVWYYRRRASSAEDAASAAETRVTAAEGESAARSKAEDQRNDALVASWKTGMASAKENTDAEKALDRWRAVTDGLHPEDGHGN